MGSNIEGDIRREIEKWRHIPIADCECANERARQLERLQRFTYNCLSTYHSILERYKLERTIALKADAFEAMMMLESWVSYLQELRSLFESWSRFIYFYQHQFKIHHNYYERDLDFAVHCAKSLLFYWVLRGKAEDLTLMRSAQTLTSHIINAAEKLPSEFNRDLVAVLKEQEKTVSTPVNISYCRRLLVSHIRYYLSKNTGIESNQLPMSPVIGAALCNENQLTKRVRGMLFPPNASSVSGREESKRGAGEPSAIQGVAGITHCI